MKESDKPGKVRVGMVQMSCSDDPGANMKKALAMTGDAIGKGAQVICLPELFRSQYFCQTEDHANFELAEAIPGPTTEALGKVAAELKVVLIASLFEKRAAGPSSMSWSASSGGFSGRWVISPRSSRLAIAHGP